MSKPDKGKPPGVVILVNGEPALTVDMAAAKHGRNRRAMNAIIERNGIPHAAVLLGSKLYLEAVIDPAVASLPGRDWRKGKGYKPAGSGGPAE